MHQFLIAIFAVIQFSVASAASDSGGIVKPEDCADLKACIQKKVDNFAYDSHGMKLSQAQYFAKLSELAKNFEAMFLSSPKGYDNEPYLEYATSLADVLKSPVAKIDDLQKQIQSKNCQARVHHFKNNAHNFYRNAVSAKTEFILHPDAWTTYESLLKPICELK